MDQEVLLKQPHDPDTDYKFIYDILAILLVSVRGLGESSESVARRLCGPLEPARPAVIRSGADLRGARCGRFRTAIATTATVCAIPAISLTTNGRTSSC